MAISAGRNRFKKNDNNVVELYRMCSKLNTNVVGGASKLIKHLQERCKASALQCKADILTYCDFSKSNGNGYKAVGFELIGRSKPGYFWTDGTSIISRYKSRKNKLKEWLVNFDENQSEAENMFAAGYRRYWDCGNLIFEMKAKC